VSPTASAAALHLAPSVLEAIHSQARLAYPNEGCGALLGPGPGRVTDSVALPNTENGQPRTRFLVEPLDYLAVEEQADARGLRLLGFWHSHPDHPARPSATDRSYAWEGWLTLVIAVERGEPRELTAWEIAGPDAPFHQLPIEVR
jgi:proteasome lid subunit RPN8/RPN11